MWILLSSLICSAVCLFACPALAIQILSGHAGTVAFALATRFGAASAAVSSGCGGSLAVDPQSIGTSATATITGAAVAARAKLLEQRRRFTVRSPPCTETCVSACETRLDTNATEESDICPFDVAVKSEYSMSGGAHLHSSKASKTAILPINEDLPSFDEGGGSGRISEEEWTMESVSDFERPHFPSSMGWNSETPSKRTGGKRTS